MTIHKANFQKKKKMIYTVIKRLNLSTPISDIQILHLVFCTINRKKRQKKIIKLPVDVDQCR